MTIRIGSVTDFVADYKTNVVIHEIPTPAPDGVQTVFTVANAYSTGTLEVYRDQSTLLIGGGHDYTETSTTTFTVASAPDNDEVLWVKYLKS